MKEPFDNKNKFKKKKPLGSKPPKSPPPNGTKTFLPLLANDGKPDHGCHGKKTLLRSSSTS